MNEQTPLLQLDHIKAKKKDQVLEIYSATLFPGLVYQIQGPNGSGKTMLLDVFAHTLPVREGTIYFEGKSGAKKQYSAKIVKQQICYIAQDTANYKKTPLATLLDAAKAQKLSSAQSYRAAMGVLEEYGLQSIANRKMLDLSSGTRKKIELLKVFLQKPRLIILDDPGFESLDDHFVQNYVKMLKKDVKQENRTLVIASAQSLLRYRLIDITLNMNKGHIIRVEKTYQRKPDTRKKSVKKS